jgi:hypothetical protein
MKDDAAKIVIYILAISFGLGLLVLGGHYLVTGHAYTPEFCLESNKEAGFYPYNPPSRNLDEAF